MKSKVYQIVLLNLLLATFFVAGNGFSQDGNKVILVYKRTLQVDIHKKQQDSDYWKYFQDTYRYYNLVEFDPVERTYGKEYVIKYYGKEDKTQSQVKGMSYEELDKYKKSNQRYLKATSFSANDDGETGNIRMRYGIVNLKSTLDIGWDEKVAVAQKLRDKVVYRGENEWKNFSDKSYSCIFQKRYTKEINEKGLTLDEAFKYMSQKLVDRGYQPLLETPGEGVEEK